MPDQSLACLEYRVLDRDKNVIELAEEKDLESSSTKKSKNKARRSERNKGTTCLECYKLSKNYKSDMGIYQSSD